ncbi:MAG: PatB family C-S lyase [Bacilli bacterium]|nr:PatB family C-S lyase [Bacilli bacterium]
MKYNFDKITDRSNQFCCKWNKDPRLLPMTIADMDFEVAPAIQNAILNKAKTPTYGYVDIPNEFNEAVVSWYNRRHNMNLTPDMVIFSSGVICALSSIVRKLTTPAENVLLQFPVYNTFFNSIVNNGRNIVSSDLVYENGEYHIDWEDLEEKLSNPQTSLMIVCNPHNPIGKNWTKEELARIGELARKHGVQVVSDEIHSDVQNPGHKFTSWFESSEENANTGIVCNSTSKTFNLAGMHSASVLVKDPVLRHKVWRGINTDEVGEPNFFAIDVAIAAYNDSEDWVNECNAYIYENKCYVIDYCKKNIKQVNPLVSPATYILWLDISGVTLNDVKFAEYLKEKTGLVLNPGSKYGTNGKGFLRMNVATQKSRVEDAMSRLEEAVKSYKD